MTAIGGRLGTPQILATQDPIVIYTTPSGYSAIANLSILNRGTTAVSVKVAVSETNSPILAEYIEWNTVIVPRGVLERTQIVMQPGRRIIVSTDTINQVAVTAYGLLTPTNVSFEGVEEVLEEQGTTDEIPLTATASGDVAQYAPLVLNIDNTVSQVAGTIVYEADQILASSQITSTTGVQWEPVKKSDIALQGNTVHVLFRRGNSSNLAELRAFNRNPDGTLSFITNQSLTLASSTQNQRVNGSIVYDPIRDQLIIVQISNSGLTGMSYTYVTFSGSTYTLGSTSAISSPTISGAVFGNSNNGAIHALWDSNRSRITVAAVEGARATIATFTNNGSSLSASNFINATTPFASSSLIGFEHPSLVQLASGSFLVLYGYNSVRGIIANVNSVNGSMSWGTAVNLNTSITDVAAHPDQDEFICTVGGSNSISIRFTYSGTTISSQGNSTVLSGTFNSPQIVYDNFLDGYRARVNDGTLERYYSWDGSTWTQESSVSQVVFVSPYNIVSTATGMYQFDNSFGSIRYNAVTIQTAGTTSNLNNNFAGIAQEATLSGETVTYWPSGQIATVSQTLIPNTQYWVTVDGLIETSGAVLIGTSINTNQIILV